MTAQVQTAPGPTLSDLAQPSDNAGESEIERLRSELAETRARLDESRGELARLVRLTEAELGRTRPGESADLAGKRRPAPAEVNARLTKFVNLITATRGWRKPGVPQDQVLAWLMEAGLFDPQYYLKVNPDLAANGMDPGHHYMNYGMTEGRLPSRL